MGVIELMIPACILVTFSKVYAGNNTNSRPEIPPIFTPCGKYQCNALKQYCVNKFTGDCGNCKCNNPQSGCEHACAVERMLSEYDIVHAHLAAATKSLTETETKVSDLTTENQELRKDLFESNSSLVDRSKSWARYSERCDLLLYVGSPGAALLFLLTILMSYDYLFFMKQNLHSKDLRRKDITLMGKICGQCRKYRIDGAELGRRLVHPTNDDKRHDPKIHALCIDNRA